MVFHLSQKSDNDLAYVFLLKQESIPVGCVPTVCALVTNRCQYQWSGVEGWRPQVNKFELVSSNGHQMSLTVGTRAWAGGPIFDIWGGGLGQRGTLSDVQSGGAWEPCTVRSITSWIMVTCVMVTWESPVDRMTDRQIWLKALTSLNFFGG